MLRVSDAERELGHQTQEQRTVTPVFKTCTLQSNLPAHLPGIRTVQIGPVFCRYQR